MSLACCFLLIATAAAQSSLELPPPSGSFAVGRVAYDWTDPSRPELLSRVSNTHREILVDVWYPAAPPKPGARTAPYLPHARKIATSPAASAEINNWGALWESIASGKIQTHTYENAPVAAGDPAGTAKALNSLRLVESYTVAFFDKVLKGAQNTWLDREPASVPPQNTNVRITHYRR